MKTLIVVLLVCGAADDDAVLRYKIERLREELNATRAEVSRLQEVNAALLKQIQQGSAVASDSSQPTVREWTGADDKPLGVGEFIIVKDGRAVIRFGDQEKRVPLSDLSRGDQEWVHDWMADLRKYQCPRCRDTGVIKCPNQQCRNGRIYGPVSGTANIAVGGRRDTVTISGRGPVGVCPTCGGRGAVVCPDCHGELSQPGQFNRRTQTSDPNSKRPGGR